MKRAISLLLAIVMTIIALAGCDSKSENPAGNANSKQPTDESITIKNSPDKYTWYIKNYVGKSVAPPAYSHMLAGMWFFDASSDEETSLLGCSL